ncbi:hypothetical protein J1N35_025315 [Gossypium stocksii]|uniref:Uncharacterized protein n=1 Tax=Gossypium stocksii TaxID=47602 RepID=A0A9D3V626_9ROSI|nr:hypothetical protein J1N35_025315 [Gossypium stocksii]
MATKAISGNDNDNHQSINKATPITGNTISKQEQVSIILTGLLVKYESIRIVTSVMSVPLDLLAEMLTDCEARQQKYVSNMPLQANVAQHSETGDKGARQFDRGGFISACAQPMFQHQQSQVLVVVFSSGQSSSGARTVPVASA